MGRTRIAPTPSGFLHVGNLVNFRLTHLVAQELDLDLVLRIDDYDVGRVRPDYVADIHRWLEALDIRPDSTAPSQSDRYEYYRHELLQLNALADGIFICGCSRSQRPDGVCINGCSGGLTSDTALSANVRVRAVGVEESLWIGNPPSPTYHLVNIVDDRDLGITHVVRGVDLEASSRLHRAVSRALPGRREIRYAHHALVTAADGSKLSKSNSTAAGPLVASPETIDAIDHMAQGHLPHVLAQFKR